MSFRGTGAVFAFEAFVRNNATAGRRPPDPYPLSACWWAYYETLPDVYITLFGMGPLAFTAGDYWCCSIGPWGPGTATTFAMSANGLDVDSGLLFAGMTGKWIPQGVTVWKDATTAYHRFYPDLTRHNTYVGIQDVALPWFNGLQADTMLFIGAPPWANQEGVDGSMGALKIWQARLQPSDLLRESASPYPVKRQYNGQLFGAYPARQNFKLATSPGDILMDVSGRGNHLYQSRAADNINGSDGAGSDTWQDPPIPMSMPLRRRSLLGLVPQAAAGAGKPWVHYARMMGG